MSRLLLGHKHGLSVNTRGPAMRDNMHMPKGSFTDRLRDAMSKEGLKGPVQLGKRVKVNKQTASKWINGLTTNLSADDLYRLSNGLNVAARWLWTGAGPMMPRSAHGKEEERALVILSALPPAWREDWLQDGQRTLARLELPATATNPFPKARIK